MVVAIEVTGAAMSSPIEEPTCSAKPICPDGSRSTERSVSCGARMPLTYHWMTDWRMTASVTTRAASPNMTRGLARTARKAPS